MRTNPKHSGFFALDCPGKLQGSGWEESVAAGPYFRNGYSSETPPFMAIASEQIICFTRSPASGGVFGHRWR